MPEPLREVSHAISRKAGPWIESFLELTDHTQSPRIFRKWAAASIIAGALERKVWIKAFGRILYPNMYVLLVGGPGVGKTDGIREVFDFSSKVPTLHLAPSNISRASLIDSLNKATRTVLRPTDPIPHQSFNMLTAAADEFGVFLAQYETSFMSTLNKLYDGTIYTEEKRSMKDGIKMEKPLLNIIAGTTPAWLGGTLPETAWAEGFSSRLVLIYSGERIKVDPFTERFSDDNLRHALESDLKDIHHLYGQISWEEDVVQAFRDWYMADCPPIPDHPKLEHYIPRRHIHLLKLCIVMSAQRSSDLVIRMEDYQTAMNMFLEAESYMPDVFRSMRMVTGDSAVYDETYRFVHMIWSKEGKGVPEHRIIHFISQRAPSHSVRRILELMVESNVLLISNVAGAGGRPEYKPTPKIDQQ